LFVILFIENQTYRYFLPAGNDSSLNSRLCDCGRKTAKEDSKGGKPLAYLGIFSEEQRSVKKIP